MLISAELTGSRCLTKWISGDTEFSVVRYPERNPWYGSQSGVLGAFRGALDEWGVVMWGCRRCQEDCNKEVDIPGLALPTLTRKRSFGIDSMLAPEYCGKNPKSPLWTGM